MKGDIGGRFRVYDPESPFFLGQPCIICQQKTYFPDAEGRCEYCQEEHLRSKEEFVPTSSKQSHNISEKNSPQHD